MRVESNSQFRRKWQSRSRGSDFALIELLVGIAMAPGVSRPCKKDVDWPAERFSAST